MAVGDLFEETPAAGSTVVCSASSSDPSVRVAASGAAVTVTAVSAGSATVRVDARVRDGLAVSSAVPQTRADEAAVEQVVTVADAPLQVTLGAEPSAGWKRAARSPGPRARTGPWPPPTTRPSG